MKNPVDMLIETLEEMGYVQAESIFLQGNMPKELPYPDSFFTFRNFRNEYNIYRDNEPMQTDWTFSLNFYSNDVTKVDSTMLEAITKLKKKGFTARGKGTDAISDEPTHTGKENTLIYRENN